jgi:hypothetical protein
MKNSKEQTGKDGLYEIIVAGYCAIVAGLLISAIIYMLFFQK